MIRFGAMLCLALAAVTCSGTASPTPATPSAPASSPAPASAESQPFRLTTPVGVEGGTLPADYTCDGSGASPELAWSNAPAGTQEFALLMTTLPGDGTTKWNWVLYNIPASVTNLARSSRTVGTFGVGSDGPSAAYQPPCSQGPGAKLYTFTLYALSGAPRLAGAGAVTGAALTAAIAPVAMGSAVLNLSYSRPR